MHLRPKRSHRVLSLVSVLARVPVWVVFGVSVGASATAGCSFIDDFSSFSFEADAGRDAAGSDSGTSDVAGDGPTDVSAVDTSERDACASCVTMPAIDLGTGSFHSCAVLEDETLWCWGSNTCGELGVSNGERSRELAPVRVPVPPATQVATGSDFTCVLTSGTVHCFGTNGSGQLGDGTEDDRFTPLPVTGLAGVQQIVTGDSHACALLAGGTAQCWGTNLQDQLGNPGAGISSAVPLDVMNLSGVVRLFAGGDHTCALLESNEGVCWGSNVFGEIGINQPGNTVDVPGARLPLSGVRAIGTGFSHTCAVHSAGVSCWGENDVSQTGQASGAEFREPQTVDVPSEMIDLSVGGGASHSCAITAAAGELYCWGNSNWLGAGPMDVPGGRYMPVPVTAPGGATQVRTGPAHSCAIIATQVYCWGTNDWGQLGVGTQAQHLVPMRVLF